MRNSLIPHLARPAALSPIACAIRALASGGVSLLLTGSLPTWAQTCPSPAVANGSACTVPAGTVITLTTSGGIALRAVGAGGAIDAGAVTLNLNAAGVAGGLADQGGMIWFTNSDIRNTAGQATASRIGLRAIGSGSFLGVNNSVIRLGPATGNASGLTALSVENGAAAAVSGTSIDVQGGTAGTDNRGVKATGAGSTAAVSGTTINVSGRAAYGVLAEAGGAVILDSGTQVAAAGTQATGSPTIGSLALFATGTAAGPGGAFGSSITGTGISASSSATQGNAVRVQDGGTVRLTGSALSASGTGNNANAAAAVYVLPGGSFSLDGSGSSITTTGALGHGVQVEGAGATATLSGASITTIGSRGTGVHVSGGGSATVTGGNVQASSGAALWALGSGSSISATDLTAHSDAATGFGVRADTGASVELLRGTYSMATGNRVVLFAIGAGSSVTATDVGVLTAGWDETVGVRVDAGARITLNGGSIDTTGTVGNGLLAHGMGARDAGSVLAATATRVLTSGRLAHGMVADDGGSIVLSGNTVRTRGDAALGLYSLVEHAGPQFAAGIAGANVTVSTSGNAAHGAMAAQGFFDSAATIGLSMSSVTTSGDAAAGLRAITGASVAVSQSTVATTGTGAHGAWARDNGSAVGLAETRVTTSGANAHGALAESGGRITGTNTAVSATGANAAALYAVGAPGFAAAAAFSNYSTLTNSSGPVIAVGGLANISLDSSTVSGSGEWLRVATPGAFAPLAAPDPAPLGLAQLRPDPSDPLLPALPPVAAPAALTVAPGLATITANASRLTGSAFTAPGSVSNLTLSGGTVWNMTGSSNISNLANDASNVVFSAPASGAFKTLTVNNYNGLPGSGIGLNTVLNADGSLSDLLVINGGTAAGNTALRISNAGGLGAQTTADGIQVVDATNGGTTAGGTFRLAAPAVAGVYEYRLLRGGASGNDPDDWFLRSVQATQPPGPLPAPLLRPEIGSYLANQRLAGGMFLHSLHDRLGEPQWIETQGFRKSGDDADKPRAAWLRFVDKHAESSSRDGVLGVESDTALVHGGIDVARWSSDGTDRWLWGAMAGYGWGKSDSGAQGNPRRSEGMLHGLSLGLYGTWHQNKPDQKNEHKLGWHADGWVQYGWFRNEVQGEGLPLVKYDSRVLSVSAETGYATRVADNSEWIVEPQGQLVWGQFHGKGVDEPNGTHIDGGKGTGWVGRLGVRLHRTWVHDDGTRTQPYLTLNWWHDQMDGTLRFNAVAMRDLWPADRYEVKLGVNAQRGEGWSSWGNLAFQWGQQAYRAFTFRVGAKKAW